MAKDEHVARFLFVLHMDRNAYEDWIIFFVLLKPLSVCLVYMITNLRRGFYVKENP
jgi:hypothetical protein